MDMYSMKGEYKYKDPFHELAASPWTPYFYQPI